MREAGERRHPNNDPPENTHRHPAADQILYKGEAPKYDTSGEAKGETAAFSGQLAIDSPTNLIIPGDLKLIDNDKFLASNYKLELTPDIPCTYTDKLPEEARVELGGDKKGEWYAGAVIFSAPPGFTIKLKEVEETGIQTKAISPLIASRRSLRPPPSPSAKREPST